MAIVEQDRKTAPLPTTALLHDWVITVDHKKIGILYLLASLVFLVFGGIEALLMRTQLWTAGAKVIGPDTFNQMFTMHGTTMIFFVVMPILIGMANYVVPLQIGARDMAFPRLNAFSFWLFLFGGLLLYYSFIVGAAPNIGWFGYAPLTSSAFSRGTNTDYWILGLFVSGVGTGAGAINLFATIMTMRAPGMTLGKVTLFVWMMLWTALLLIVAFPPFTAAALMLLFDRQLGAHFFDTQAGGSAVLWQHLFWFFGHPEVYIMALPAFGMISEIIPVFSRKVIFGYESVALATVGIGFISLSVWVHHMFTVGLSPAVDAFFSGATFLIAVPTGIKMFNWVATLYGGKLRFDTPLLYSLGFLAMFLIGGLTGIMLAAVPFDWQMSDSYFVVAHFHNVLFGGTLFAIFAATFYWFPKMTGRMLDERLGKWQFWILLIGFILTFGPMHVAGALGMPRRIYTYQPGRGWEIWNQLATVGAYLLGVAFLLFGWNMVRSLRRGRIAGDDPWDAWTLEWATTSPPPSYNFEVVPKVLSRRPLWDEKHPDDPDWLYEHPGAEIRELRPGEALPHSLTPRFGMAAFLLTETAFFSTLVVAYLTYLRQSQPVAHDVLGWPIVLLSSVCLFSSSATIHFAIRALQNGNVGGYRQWWALTILLGLFFLGGTAYEWHDLIYNEGQTISTNLFGTTYFTLVGFHAFHVTMGLVLLISVLGMTWEGPIAHGRVEGAELVSWYWHFVDVVWIVVFVTVYVVGRYA